jgi:hypothetical protein
MLLAISSAVGASTLTTWGSIWAIVAGAIATLIFLWQVARWGIRKIKLAHPCDVHFIIPNKERAEIEYLQQDDRVHKTDCLVLPANSKSLVSLYIKPKLWYEEQDMYFGCEGDFYEKPEPKKYHNYHVRDDIASGGEVHYIDSDKMYHIVRRVVRIPSEDYITGYIVQTHASGKYEARLRFLSTERLGIVSLQITVEDPVTTLIRCIDHKNCFLQPKSKEV